MNEDKRIEAILRKAKKDMSNTIRTQMMEVFALGKERANVVLIEQMYDEIGKIYGTFYNQESLSKSFSIVNKKNILPEISYNSNTLQNFYFDNISRMDDLDSYSLDSENELSWEEDDYLSYIDYDGDTDNIDLDAIDKNNKKFNFSVFDYHSRINRDAGYTPKAQAFKTASTNATNYFKTNELPKLRAYSKKKLGFDIF